MNSFEGGKDKDEDSDSDRGGNRIGIGGGDENGEQGGG